VREALRLTMFAPTVTGSPMQNACAVIARHEPKPRGYYAGVLALFEPRTEGYDLDAPILIRAAHLGADGQVSVPAGATLVRHSTPEGEVAETRAKAAGVLAALGLLPRQPSVAAIDLNAQPGVAEALAARNERLASFWIRPQGTDAAASAPHEKSALVIDNEDQFTTMLAHQLRHLGLAVRVAHWAEVDSVADHDLVVFGPGPGDPRDLSERRIARLRALMLERLRAQQPLLAVCLSHQVLAELAGFELAPLLAPRQGVRLEVDVFGQPAAIGFYNTFGARAPQPFETLASRAPQGAEPTRTEVSLEASVDPDGIVTALRGPGVASVQGHLESVLSSDGYATLRRLVDHALYSAAPWGSSVSREPVR
jgi:phenazine biosynthesis protein phzE